MKIVIQKPITVEADTEQEITLQVAKTTITDQNGEMETEPTICLNVDNGKEGGLTLNQVSKFIRLLETVKQEVLKCCQTIKK